MNLGLIITLCAISFFSGIAILVIPGIISARKRSFPKAALMKGLFSSLGQSVDIEEFQERNDMFGYYYNLFKQYKDNQKNAIGEAAVLQLLYLCYKLYRGYMFSTDTIQKIYGGVHNLSKDLPLVQDFLMNDGMKIISNYQGNLASLNKDFDREFLEFIDSQYESV